MNFLAHLALSYHDADLQMGNFLGDYTKGKPPAHYPAGVRNGIVLHRQIDAATDQHHAVRAVVLRLKDRHGPYAGVVADIFFDYYLYQNWDQWALPHFPEFCDLTYTNLAKQSIFLRPALQNRLQSMLSHRWLDTYTSPAGILAVFTRMRPRFSQPAYLEEVGSSLAEEALIFNQAIVVLFPDLMQVVNKFRGPY